MNKTNLRKLEKSIDNVDRLSNIFRSASLNPNDVKLVKFVIRKSIKTWGIKTATAQLKSYYNDSLRYALGAEIVPSSPIWVKRDLKGFPKVLSRLKNSLRNEDLLTVRLTLSLLRVYEAVQLEVDRDISSIEDESQGGHTWTQKHKAQFEFFLRASPFGTRLKKSYEQAKESVITSNRKPKLHVSFKKSVLGPAVSLAGKEASYLSKEMTNLLDRFTKSFGKGKFPAHFDFGRPDARTMSWIDIVNLNKEFFAAGQKDLQPIAYNHRLGQYPLGRIGFIPDKGGKTRVVAIGNYWVQDALKDLHTTLYTCLRELPTDGTYKQNDSARNCRIASQHGPVWSLDLTSATDRFPLQIQQDVLNFLDPEIGSIWTEILSKMDFDLGPGVDPAIYRVGQPMGLYSSWAIFAITNHCLINYAHWLALPRQRGKTCFIAYSVLGDDVAIWLRAVAHVYKRILGDLEVQISKSKSHDPDEEKPNEFGYNVAEFAKRQFLNGVEYSPVTPNLLNLAFKNYSDLVSLFDWLECRGYACQHKVATASRLLDNLPDPVMSRRGKLTVLLPIVLWEQLSSKKLIEDDSDLDLASECPSIQEFLEYRLQRLDDQLRSMLSENFYDSDEQQGLALEERLGPSFPYELYFCHLISARILELEETRLEMSKASNPGDLQNLLEAAFQDHKPSDPLTHLREIEYVPALDLSSMLLGKTEFTEKKSLRNRFIREFITNPDQFSAIRFKQEDENPFDDPFAGADGEGDFSSLFNI